MAPEDVLNGVDESRRDFLRKVIAGTAFAAPLMASFSMEGLLLEPAEALVSNGTCDNMPPAPPCCELAEQISVCVGCFICCVGVTLENVGASPPVKAALFRPLGKALNSMGEGMDEDEGEEGCVGEHSVAHFRTAKNQLNKFFKLLKQLCGSSSNAVSQITSQFNFLISSIDRLLVGDCAGGLSAIEESRQQSKLRRSSAR